MRTRSVGLNVRVSPAEKQRIQTAAGRCGLTLSEYLRQRALARLLREDGHTVHIAALEGEGLVAEPLGPGLALAHGVF